MSGSNLEKVERMEGTFPIKSGSRDANQIHCPSYPNVCDAMLRYAKVPVRRHGAIVSQHLVGLRL